MKYYLGNNSLNIIKLKLIVFGTGRNVITSSVLSGVRQIALGAVDGGLTVSRSETTGCRPEAQVRCVLTGEAAVGRLIITAASLITGQKKNKQLSNLAHRKISEQK